MNYKILLVDDEPANLRMLERLFRADYDVAMASSGIEALELMALDDFALIISDQRMPGIPGIEFLKRAAVLRPHSVRIILTGYTDVSDLVEAINSGIIYKYITKPWVNTDLVQVVQRSLEHYDTNRRQHLLNLENERLESRACLTAKGFVGALREIIAQKNSNLAEHCRRTSNYAAIIGEQLNLESNDMEVLIYASLVHELPNIRLPFNLDINKAALTAEQLKVTRNSYENGLNLISSVPEFQDVATTICFQHEHFDGTGFFDGLDGDKIPLLSRILAVANAFDEINSGRNPALFCTDEEAAEWFRRRSGTEFDPEIVDACLRADLRDPAGMVPSGSSREIGNSLAMAGL